MKTTLYYFILLFGLTLQSAYCQALEQKDITGKWTVTQAMIDPSVSPKEKEMMELMKKGLIHSTLEFRENGKFYITFPKDAPAFMKEMKVLNNKDWIFNKEKQQVATGTKEDKYNELQLFVKKRDGKFWFIMSDTPIVLEMVKQ